MPPGTLLVPVYSTVTIRLSATSKTLDASRVEANFVETLVFRFLATPLALLLVVLQSRYLHVEGRASDCAQS